MKIGQQITHKEIEAELLKGGSCRKCCFKRLPDPCPRDLSDNLLCDDAEGEHLGFFKQIKTQKMTPPKFFFLENDPRLFEAYETKLRPSDITYIRVEAIQDWINGNVETTSKWSDGVNAKKLRKFIEPQKNPG